VGDGVPLQEPLVVVIIEPTTTEPLIYGGVVLLGGTSTDTAVIGPNAFEVALATPIELVAVTTQVMVLPTSPGTVV